MKKRLTAISLFLLWTAQASLPFIVFQIERISCRSNSITSDINTPILSFTFQNENEISWEVCGKELIKTGKLYDVVSIKKNGKKIVVNCKSDEKEDLLVATYKSSTKEDAKEKKNSLLQKKLLEIKYTTPQAIVTADFVLPASLSFMPAEHRVKDIVLDVACPPPQG